jgi:integrase
MVLQMPRPYKHPKTGIYYFRARVPHDLVKAVGKPLVKVTLRTKDPALAKELFAEKAKEIAGRWKTLRLKPEPLTQKQMVALSGKVYRKIIERFDEDPGDPSTWTNIVSLARSVAASGKWEQWYGGTVDELLLSEGVNTDSESRDKLIRLVHDALIQASEQQEKKALGDYSPDPRANRFPPLHRKNRSPSKVTTLTDLFKLWERDHLADGGSPRTPGDFLQKVQSFKSYLGHEDVNKITPLNVSEYCDKLKHDDGLSAKTVSGKYLAAIRTIFRVGMSKSRIAVDPTANVKVSVPKAVRERSKGFTEEEATRILSCALADSSTLGGMSPLNKLACRWVPWICAYTGARAGEITQLRREDFFEEFGVPCIRITPEAGSVKTGNYRIAPVHPHLVELGLLEMVSKAPPGPLFYKPNDNKRKPGHTQAASVRGKVSDWVRDVAKVTDPRVQPNHAWRHRFKTIARDVDIPHEYMNAIQGHEDGTAASDYGENTVKALYREIKKLPRYEV